MEHLWSVYIFYKPGDFYCVTKADYKKTVAIVWSAAQLCFTLEEVSITHS
jgi:hypothetical protein